MDNFRDPRMQIPTNLKQVQDEMEQAIDDRKKEIRQEMKDQTQSLKDEAKDLKQIAEDKYKDYKEQKKDSGDPLADEKIATAKKATQVVTKDIDLDYKDTKDRIEQEAEGRMESLDRMMDVSDKDKEDYQNNPFYNNPTI